MKIQVKVMIKMIPTVSKKNKKEIKSIKVENENHVYLLRVTLVFTFNDEREIEEENKEVGKIN